MQAKSCGTQQISFLMPTLGEQLDPRQPLKQLADQIPWEQFECQRAVKTSQGWADENRPL
jgi:hypothetical protein